MQIKIIAVVLAFRYGYGEEQGGYARCQGLWNSYGVPFTYPSVPLFVKVGNFHI